jgi:hypothetical protein
VSDLKISEVLEELADWIMFRTRGTEPRDTSRIQLARETAKRMAKIEAAIDGAPEDTRQTKLFEEGDWTEQEAPQPFHVDKGVADPPPEQIDECSCPMVSFSWSPHQCQFMVHCLCQSYEVPPSKHNIQALGAVLAEKHKVPLVTILKKLESMSGLLMSSGTTTLGIASLRIPLKE